jgi:CRP-like cAMP-binding protein
MKVGEGMLPKKTSESIGSLLRRTAIFSEMSDETERTLSALGETVFSAGDMIVDAEDFDSFRGLGVMLSGKASVYGKGSDRHVLLNHLGPSNIFGAATVFFSEREAVSTVSAQTKCRILFIERSVLEKVMKNDFAVSSAYIAFLSERICFLNRKITGFTAKSADAALAGYLLRAVGDTGVLTVNMSRMASILGIGRTTLYRAVDTLEQEGAIAYDGKKMRVLDREALERKSKS